MAFMLAIYNIEAASMLNYPCYIYVIFNKNITINNNTLCLILMKDGANLFK